MLVYVKKKNVILAWKQKPVEALDKYLNELKTLAKGCDFKAVSSEQYNSGMIRDALMSNAFINGLMSNAIRQRLLENKTLDLQPHLTLHVH